MTTSAPPPEAILLTQAQVCAMIGFAGRTLRTWVSAGKFPRPVSIAGRDERRCPKRWLRTEVEGWIADLAKGRE